MKPRFDTLKRNLCATARLSAEAMRAEIGRTGDEASAQAAAQVSAQVADLVGPNASTVRMSLALVKSGITLNGRLAIAAGPNAGHTIEPRARRLADQLARPGLLGEPESIDATQALAQLSGRRGIVFYSKPQVQGGHVELIEPTNASRICHAATLFPGQEIRFWPLA